MFFYFLKFRNHHKMLRKVYIFILLNIFIKKITAQNIDDESENSTKNGKESIVHFTGFIHGVKAREVVIDISYGSNKFDAYTEENGKFKIRMPKAAVSDLRFSSEWITIGFYKKNRKAELKNAQQSCWSFLKNSNKLLRCYVIVNPNWLKFDEFKLAHRDTTKEIGECSGSKNDQFLEEFGEISQEIGNDQNFGNARSADLVEKNDQGLQQRPPLSRTTTDLNYGTDRSHRLSRTYTGLNLGIGKSRFSKESSGHSFDSGLSRLSRAYHELNLGTTSLEMLCESNDQGVVGSDRSHLSRESIDMNLGSARSRLSRKSIDMNLGSPRPRLSRKSIDMDLSSPRPPISRQTNDQNFGSARSHLSRASTDLFNFGSARSRLSGGSNDQSFGSAKSRLSRASSNLSSAISPIYERKLSQEMLDKIFGNTDSDNEFLVDFANKKAIINGKTIGCEENRQYKIYKDYFDDLD